MMPHTSRARPPRTTRLVALFPGQGSQRPGAGKKLAKECDHANAVYDLADRVLNRDSRALCWDTSQADLRRTELAQPVLCITSLAAWSSFVARSRSAPSTETITAAGHSSGSVAAAAVAGFLSFESAIELSAARGTTMSRAPGEGSMLAVSPSAYGGSLEEEARRLAAELDLELALVNSSRQVVLSGYVSKVADAKRRLGMRSAVIDVAHAFHSSLMKPVLEDWRRALADVSWTLGRGRYVSNITGRTLTSPEDVRHDLELGLTTAVRWTQVVDTIHQNDPVVILGLGEVLLRLMRGTEGGRGVVIDSLSAIEKVNHE